MNSDLLIISPFPSVGAYSHQKSALASYSYNLTRAILKRNKRIVIEILSDTRRDNKISRLKVTPSWRRNDWFLFWRLFQKIRQRKPNNILIHYEWSLFGWPIFYALQLPLFISCLRLLGKKVYFVSHGVMTSYETQPIFNIFLKSFYRLVSLVSSKVIVFEQKLKDNLDEIGVSRKKIVVIPHGVDTSLMPISKAIARKRLKINSNETVLMYFGFITQYKGPDILLDLFSEAYTSFAPSHSEWNEESPTPCLPAGRNVGNRAKLFFCGGPSLHLSTKDAYYQNFINKANKTPNVVVTGFVEPKKIPLYFSAADLVVLPHATFISSSGPLSLAFSYAKPFILSKNLAGYFKSRDFANAARKLKINSKQICFDLDAQGFKKTVSWAFKNQTKLTKLSILMKQARRFDIIAERYLSTMSSPT